MPGWAWYVMMRSYVILIAAMMQLNGLKEIADKGVTVLGVSKVGT